MRMRQKENWDLDLRNDLMISSTSVFLELKIENLDFPSQRIASMSDGSTSYGLVSELPELVACASVNWSDLSDFCC